MNEDFSLVEAAERRHRTQKRLMLAIGLAAFVLGVAATFYMTRPGFLSFGDIFQFRSDAVEEAPAVAVDVAAPAAVEERTTSQQTVADAREAVERVEQVVEQQGGLDQRLAAMEQRLTRLDLQSEAAAGNAARAEGLLVAFATRRTIERGAPLGYLSDQLRLRFGDARPNAVQTVIDAAQEPATLDQLLARLEGLATVLIEIPAEEGTWAWISREMGQLFVVRREDAPSPASERRLQRARLFLESGRAEAAVAEIRHLPNAAAAADWIEDAERYAAAQRALELLEMTAILEPRELRDGSGNQVEQLSPANEAVRAN